MRMALALLLVLAFAVAGCSAPKKSGSDAGPPGEGQDGDRQSQPGSDTTRSGQNGVQTKDVALVDQPIQIIGPGSASFDAVVPGNTSKVTFLLTSQTELLANSLVVALDGCGQSSPTGVYGGTTPGGASVYGGEVCGAASAGKHTVTVTNGPGYIDGTFQLIGQVPDAGNATATA